MRSRLLLLATALVGVAVGVGGTLAVDAATAPDPAAMVSGTYGGSSKPDAEAGATYSFDGGPLCIEGGGFATIRAIRPRTVEGAGVEVVGYTIRTDIRSDETTTSITTACKADTDDGQRLFVKVRAAELPAGTDGYVIDYQIDGRHETTANDNWGLLCDGKIEDVMYGDIIPKCNEFS